MEKDFLKKYEDEIREIVRDMLNAEKQWKINRIKGMYKDILDEFIKCTTNINIKADNYLPVYIATNHLEEENQYAHLLFIFKLDTSEILILLVFDDVAVLDLNIVGKTIYELSNKKKVKGFFSEIFQNDTDMSFLFDIIEGISKSVNILKIEFHKRYVEELNTLFNIMDKIETMTLFGYFLYISLYKQFLLSYKYYSLLNIVFNIKNDEIRNIRAVCSLFYSIVFTDKEIPSENVFTTDDISTEEYILEKFKDATKFRYAYKIKSKNGKFIIIDYSEPSKRKSINNVLNLYSKKTKEKLFNMSIAILSKKKISDDKILHIDFKDFNDDNYKIIKKQYDLFQDYIVEFEDFIDDKYQLSDTDYEYSAISKSIKKMSKKIYSSAVIEQYQSNRYAPIILALHDFFEFFRNKHYISQKDYDKFISLCDTIYGAENTQIDIGDTNINVDPIVVFTKTIYELYKNNIELFADDNTRQPFRYYNTKNKKEMICFNHITYVISFVKNNKDMITSYNDFSNIFIESESTEDLLQQIRDSLTEKQIQVVNKNRKDYRIGKSSYFAIDALKLKEFVTQCE